MANMCSNFLWTNSLEVNEIMTALYEKSKETNEGVTIEELPEPLYMFDLYKAQDFLFHFETRWSPAYEIAEYLAKKFNTEVNLEYDENGSYLFGRLYYTGENVTKFELTEEDFAKYEYEEETDSYIFEGERYESENIIKEELLDRKENKNDN